MGETAEVFGEDESVQSSFKGVEKEGKGGWGGSEEDQLGDVVEDQGTASRTETGQKGLGASKEEI